LNSRSTQTYENLTENPELQALESHAAPRSEATCIYITGAAKGLVTSRENEEVSREMHGPTTDPHNLDQSDGNLSMTSTSAREGMPTVH
jgi:hypothetical protein